MKTKYGMGLGINSMEGREAKHVFICKYSNNTVYQHRWQQIFMHEFVTLIWLRSRGLWIYLTLWTPRWLIYQTRYLLIDNTVCYCGLTKLASADKCDFCSHSLRQAVETSCKKIVWVIAEQWLYSLLHVMYIMFSLPGGVGKGEDSQRFAKP
jgi:hypothetical protein